MYLIRKPIIKKKRLWTLENSLDLKKNNLNLENKESFYKKIEKTKDSHTDSIKAKKMM